ncbi:MAG: universal stress protein [Sideroxydans sp.]|nr:universal stress protein [Sideroxydans sp.]
MSGYPFNKIMLATEHTEFDVGAERLAFAMAKRCGVPLHVVVPLLSNPEYEAEMPELALREEQAVAVKIKNLQQQASEQGVELNINVRRGDEIHAQIVAEAADLKVDLIVIRRRGKPSFFARLLVGEMVSKVIRDAHCSVLLVPRAAQFWSHRVLAAVGDTPVATNIAKSAGAVANVCGLPLTMLSVSPDQESFSKIQSINTLNVAIASSMSDKVEGAVSIGQPVEQIIATVNAVSADLVVIGRQRYHVMPFGSQGLMQHIAGKLDVPTLVIPE